MSDLLEYRSAFPILEQRFKRFTPSPSAVGLGMLLPGLAISMMVIGGCIEAVWRKLRPAHAEETIVVSTETDPARYRDAVKSLEIIGSMSTLLDPRAYQTSYGANNWFASPWEMTSVVNVSQVPGPKISAPMRCVSVIVARIGPLPTLIPPPDSSAPAGGPDAAVDDPVLVKVRALLTQAEDGVEGEGGGNFAPDFGEGCHFIRAAGGLVKEARIFKSHTHAVR
jgi:hypothetical protein